MTSASPAQGGGRDRQDTSHSQIKATSRNLLPLSLTFRELKRRQVAPERAQGSGVKIPYF